MPQIQVYTVSAGKVISKNDFDNVLLARIGLLKEALSGKQVYFYWAFHNFCFGIYDHDRRRIVGAVPEPVQDFHIGGCPTVINTSFPPTRQDARFMVKSDFDPYRRPHQPLYYWPNDDYAEYRLLMFSLIVPGATEHADTVQPICGPSPFAYGPHSANLAVNDVHNADHIVDPASASSSYASKDNESWNSEDLGFGNTFANMDDPPERQNAASITLYGPGAAEQNLNEIPVALTAEANPAVAMLENQTLIVKLRLSPIELANFVIRNHKRANVERAEPNGSGTDQLALQRKRNLKRSWLQSVGAGLAYGLDGLQEVFRPSQRSKQSRES